MKFHSMQWLLFVAGLIALTLFVWLFGDSVYPAHRQNSSFLVQAMAGFVLVGFVIVVATFNGIATFASRSNKKRQTP